MSTKILGSDKFSVWIRKTREAIGLSHSGVEKISNKGISKSYVGHLETEFVKPVDLTLKKLIVLANALKVAPLELVNRALEEALKEPRETELKIVDVPDFGKHPESPKTQAEADHPPKSQKRKRTK